MSRVQPGYNTDLINCITILTMCVVVGIAGGLTHLLPSGQSKAVLDGVIPLPGTRHLKVTARGKYVGVRTRSM
jgi:hypothetical protein